MKWMIFLLIGSMIFQSLNHAIQIDKLETKLAWAEAVKPVCKKCQEPVICIPKIISVKEPCPEFAPCEESNFNAEDCKKKYWWLFSDNEE